MEIGPSTSNESSVFLSFASFPVLLQWASYRNFAYPLLNELQTDSQLNFQCKRWTFLGDWRYSNFSNRYRESHLCCRKCYYYWDNQHCNTKLQKEYKSQTTINRRNICVTQLCHSIWKSSPIAPLTYYFLSARGWSNVTFGLYYRHRWIGSKCSARLLPSLLAFTYWHLDLTRK